MANVLSLPEQLDTLLSGVSESLIRFDVYFEEIEIIQDHNQTINRTLISDVPSCVGQDVFRRIAIIFVSGSFYLRTLWSSEVE
jgi:hypothetical protein